MRSFVLAIGVLLQLNTLPAFGWSAAGHMVIGAIAWEDLSAGTQKKVQAILRCHPEFSKWESSYREQKIPVDFSEYCFMRACVWPDEIRRRSHSDYDHPHWHYVNYPLHAPGFEPAPRPHPEDDVIYGMETSCGKISQASGEEQAVYLSWLLHLAGDIHQPLHCVAFFSPEFPQGDKGGNSFYVIPGKAPISLHSFWDQLLGTSSRPPQARNYALKIRSHHWRLFQRSLKRDKTPEAWALRQRDVALRQAYLSGRLVPAASREQATRLPAFYAKEAKAVAEKQAALAGYRLADMIRHCLPH